ncbi:MAG: 4-(cytidine 5'-diphospho)-2-C-methyl-D-erythritol kinase [Vicinamibacteria bacterium]
MTRRFRSFAKVNLGLEVTGKLPNGYHQLKTIFATVGLHDIVEIASGKSGVKVRTDHPEVPGDETNLAHRAAVAMQALAGTNRGVTIRIEKRIPVGGGVGGGSSNAATVLRALDQIWKLNLGTDGLLEVARALGADVPYFLYGGPALGLNRGDEIHPLDLKLTERLLLVPNDGGVSTAAVFRRFAAQAKSSRKRSPIDSFLRAVTSPRPAIQALRRLVNDLEPAAFAESPKLAEISRQVRGVAKSTGAIQAAMSGSGSTFFLTHPDTDSRRTAAAALGRAGIKTIASSFVSRAAYEKRFEISA